jgi:hypothetical protein
MTDEARVKQFLNSQEFMVLGVTLDDGTPWACPVRLQRWQGNEFEWDSKVDTEHSKAIAARPAMAITMFQKLPDSQIGVYMKGRGELIEERQDGFGRYRFTAEQCWLNDETFVKREVQL